MSSITEMINHFRRVIFFIILIRGLTNDCDTNSENDSQISSKIVAAIRDKMKGKGAADAPIQAYIIPSTDAHQVEYSQHSKTLDHHRVKDLVDCFFRFIHIQYTALSI